MDPLFALSQKRSLLRWQSMNNRFIALAACLLAAALFASSPAAGRAADAGLTYATSMAELPSSAPYTGSLAIHISSGGIVTGSYVPAGGSSQLLPVTGGKYGDSIWFDIGTSDVVRVQGVMVRGAIVGSAYQSTGLPLRFYAAPAPAAQP